MLQTVVDDQIFLKIDTDDIPKLAYKLVTVLIAFKAKDYISYTGEVNQLPLVKELVAKHDFKWIQPFNRSFDGIYDKKLLMPGQPMLTYGTDIAELRYTCNDLFFSLNLHSKVLTLCNMKDDIFLKANISDTKQLYDLLVENWYEDAPAEEPKPKIEILRAAQPNRPIEVVPQTAPSNSPIIVNVRELLPTESPVNHTDIDAFAFSQALIPASTLSSSGE